MVVELASVCHTHLGNMGNCSGTASGTVEEKQRSRDIDQAIKKDRKYIDHEIKILLLGAGESGKST